ncbi:MAG: glycerophosphoryl diester phosphodiesterase membrane domain-containing protein [Candidatus Acidiferrales bacterium]
MNNLDLRPLSVGEILDRTFTLYRNYFVLFIGISAIPQLLVLVLSLAQVAVLMPAGLPTPGTRGVPTPPLSSVGAIASYGLLAVLAMIVTLIALILSQGATVIAVSEIYLGRPITIGESFRRVRGELGTIFGVMMLNGLATLVGLLMFVIPGIYFMCRLIVGIPAALLENLGSRAALERSWQLTKDSAARAFLVFLLYFALSMAASMLFAAPFQMAIILVKGNPSLILVFMGLAQVGAFVANVLVVPVLTIASSILYYDLRVRKEAFDLQVMMAPLVGPVSGGVPKVFS